MNKCRFILLCIGFYFIFLFTGCGHYYIKNRVNKMWPPIKKEEKQLEAIKKANENLTKISQRVDAYASLSTEIIKENLPPEILNTFPEINKVEIKLGKQEVLLNISFKKMFEKVLNKYDITLTGNIEMVGAMYIEDQFLVLKISGERFKIKTIECPQKLPRIIPEIITSVLNEYKDNINGQIEDKRLNISFKIAKTIHPSDIWNDIKKFYNIGGKSISFIVELKKASVLIDKYAVHVMAKLSENMAKIKYNKIGKNIYNGQTVDESFERFRSSFLEIGGNYLGELSPFWKNTSALLSKSYFTGLINNTLNDLDMSAEFLLPQIGPLKFNQEIRADKAPDLKCDYNISKISCNPKMECSQKRDCNPHWNCPDCEWYDIPCHTRKGGCELDKQRYRTQCELEKKIAKDACEVEKTRLRLVCEAEKALKLAGCKTNQLWLDSWSKAKFGIVEGDAYVNLYESQIKLKSISFNEDISFAYIRFKVNATAGFDCNFKFTPVDAGHFFCQVPWGGNVSFDVLIRHKIIDLTSSINKRNPSVKSYNLILDLSIPEREICVKTETPPVVALLTQNPHFFISCAPAAALIATGAVLDNRFREDLLQDTFSLKIPAQDFSFYVEPVLFDLYGKQLKLKPVWMEKAIGFTWTQ